MEYKTTPFPHQREEVEEQGARRAWGLFWDPGTGKSWAAINTAARLARAGEVDGLLILAPSGVHRAWVEDEIPTHLPDDVAERARAHVWQTARARTQAHQAAFERAVRAPGLAVLSMSYDSLMTDAGKEAAWRLLDGRRCLYVADESQKIKTPSAKRTMRVLASAKYAPYRRILTGTPVDDSPFDVFSQVKFLDPRAWDPLGCRTIGAFRARFGVFRKAFIRRGGRRQEFNELLGYRDLDTLRLALARFGKRVRKDEVLPDLPPKLYQKIPYELSREQRRVYDAISEECRATLSDGATCTAALAIVQLTRFQQVTSGFIPADLEDGLRRIPGPNPRLRAFLDFAEGVPGQGIVWCCYDREVEDVIEGLRKIEQTSVRYDGSSTEEERAKAKARFRAGDVKWFVSKPSVGGTGLTLNEANVVAYYSVGWRLADRIQSEDRCHRPGQKSAVLYVDFVGRGTVDEKKILALRQKRDVAASITGDEIRSWI